MKNLLALCCLALLLMGCEKKYFPTEVAFKDVTFDFTLNYPDDADPGKTGWTAGDRVFVFFDQTNTFCLSLLYDGTAWRSSVLSPFGLDGMSTRSRYAMALYRPLITKESLTVDDMAWCTPEYDYGYYLASDPVPCAWDRLSGGKMKLSATMDMQCPKNPCVQFFIKDDTDGARYTLRAECFEDTRLHVIYHDELVVNERGFRGAEMIGFPCEYGGERGYLFCGLFTRNLDGAYMILTDKSSGKRWDYFFPDNSIFNSREVVHLPAPGEGSGWQAMDPDKPVAMRVGTKDLGTWYLCNYGAVTPDGEGKLVSYSEAAANDAPTREEIEMLFNGCKRTLSKVGESEGVVLQSDSGFLFFPTNAAYWTSSLATSPGLSWFYYFYYASDLPVYEAEPEDKMQFRRVVR